MTSDVKIGRYGFLRLGDSSLVFAWFGVNPCSRIHLRMESTSSCRRLVSSTEFIGLYKRMSSAYRITFAPEESGM